MNVCDYQVHWICPLQHNQTYQQLVQQQKLIKLQNQSLPFLTLLNNITIPNTTQSLTSSFCGPHYPQHTIINTLLPKILTFRNHLFHPNPFKLTPPYIFTSFPKWVLIKIWFFFCLCWKPWISGAWRSSGPFTWTSIRSLPRGGGTLWERSSAFCFCSFQFSSAGGFCSLCPFLGMDAPGTVTFLWKGMFQPLLDTPFGHSCVISRCLGWCLPGKWIERSRGLAKDLCCKCSDFHVWIGPFCLRWVCIWTFGSYFNSLTILAYMTVCH